MSPDPQRPKTTAAPTLWGLVGIGFELAAWVTMPMLIGLWIDRRFGWSPWAAVAGGILGSVGGLTILIIRAYSAQARSESRSNARKPDE
jgi:F0F1-type ATP synthase assembly protein I